MAKKRKSSVSKGNPAKAFEDAAAHHQAGRLAKAEKAYRKAIAINGDFFEAHVNLGVVLQAQEKLEGAEKSFARAIALNDSVPEIHYALGTVLSDLGRAADAAASHQRALDLNPVYVEALNGLAIALEKQGNAEGAVLTFERALDLNPGFAEAQNNLGNLYHRQGQPGDAIAAFRRAIAINPDYAEAHRNLSQALLLGGNLAEGWAEYQWRWRCRDFPSEKRAFPYALWAGEDLDRKTLLVWGEQGVGDEVHFAGQIPDLLDAGANVVVECEQRLVPLFQRSFPDATCVARKTPPDPATQQGIDFHIPSGDLGRWLRPDMDAFPDRAAYLVAEQDRVRKLKGQYRAGTKDLLIGVAWTSKNPEIGADKSMALSDWKPLASVPGVRFIDLQYGDTAAERTAFEKQTDIAIHRDDGIDQLADLDAFAAQISAMDLVISVSNTTVHFSGALGVPTWVLLNRVPLSCWMQDREDCPWHPSVRLFRQSEAGQWGDVIGRVKDALQEL
ncbi:MAG: tetratricopeptide repeat protein [Rhodospirillales bacterium]|nr:tetratricopeptide repeat protein [Rhodospirillales bacterium]